MAGGKYGGNWSLEDHFLNIIHHANTKAFTNAFFPALGSGCGWALPLLVVLLIAF